ncbi:MAG: cytochrome ubiquinol oxidase subunit I [bacterium]|jgi:cytochrome d ubiquinol oxidase subunit I
MELDAGFLSRLQFGITIAFHYLFPPLSIGLGVLLVIFEGLYLKTGNKTYELLTKFWIKIFAITFGMGVASGIVMEFQFGTNWSRYSRYVGDIFGSALAAEGVFAFFLESGFLAVLVFGWNRVSPRMHFFSTCMVSLGSIFSAIWIIVANSWQQTPAGFHVVDGPNGLRAEITDFWAVVFSPSSMIRLAHVISGALILGAFVVMSIGAYYILKNVHADFAKRGFAIALFVALFASLSQPFLGHYHAIVVAKHQPAKLAAFEAVYETTDRAPLYLWGFPDDASKSVKGSVAIPGMLSWLVHGDANATIPGLNEFSKDERPPVAVPFYSYHVMVALGMYFIALTLIGAILYFAKRLFGLRWLMWIFVFSVIGPYLANQLGWIAAEVGRQPWAVHGLLRTDEAFSVSVAGGDVLASIIIFSILYAILLALYIYVLDRRIKAGPGVFEGPEETGPYMPEAIPPYLEASPEGGKG